MNKDALFLDIQMPALNGFESLTRLDWQPLVIFTTAYDQYALRAFEVNSIDYLLKPVEQAQLERALGKLERLIGAAPAEEPAFRDVIARLAEAMKSPQPGYPTRVASRSGERVRFIELSRITHFFARDNLHRGNERLQVIAADAQARLALTTSRTQARSERLLSGAPGLARMRWLATDDIHLDQAEQWRPPPTAAAALAYLQYTSGSTSTPRGEMVTHANALHNCAYINQGFEQTSASVGLSWLPHFHDMGLIQGILQPVYVGMRCCLPQALAAKLSQSGEGVFSIDAGITIREANRKFRLKLPESDNYTTVAGFLIARAGRLLNQGDTVEYGDAKFTIERVASRRITSVKMEHSHEGSQVDSDAPAGERK